MIAVFDLDGTLSDDRWRRHLIDRSAADPWVKYHEMAGCDKLMNANLLEQHIKSADRIVILTARPEKYRTMTLGWLHDMIDERFGPTNLTLIMRPDRDKQSSPALKIKQLYAQGFAAPDIGVAYDDREDVIEELAKWGVQKTVLVGVKNDPGDVLRAMAETFEERSKTYGPNYLHFGEVCVALWPNGLTLKSKEEWVRMGLLTQIISKLTRYTNNPAGHKDSAHDIGPYAAILEAMTDED